MFPFQHMPIGIKNCSHGYETSDVLLFYLNLTLSSKISFDYCKISSYSYIISNVTCFVSRRWKISPSKIYFSKLFSC